MTRIVEYLEAVLKWRRFIVLNALALGVLAAVLTFVLPKRYTASAKLLPPSDELSMFGLSGVLGQSGLSSQLNRLRVPGTGGAGTASELIVGILASRTVMDAVAERCSIAQYYRIRPARVDEIRQTLKGITRLAVGDEGIVHIAVEANSPWLAAKVANSYVAQLDSFLRTSNISRGRNVRMFLEHRLTDARASLAEAQDSVRSFLSRYGVVSIEDETRAAIDAYARLKSQSIVKEAELGALQDVASADNPYVQSLRREASAFRSQLRGLERGSSKGGFGVGFAVSFERLPGIAAEYAKRYLDLRVQEEAVVLLYQQYEYARVLEARDTPTLTVLDYAVPPQRRSFPRRTIIVGAVFVFGLAAGVVFALATRYFAFMSLERPDEYAAWCRLGGELSRMLRRLSGFFRFHRKTG